MRVASASPSTSSATTSTGCPALAICSSNVSPNPYDVRLHGTPEQQLFTQSSRAYSHGYIRVSDPAALAEYVLKNASGNWDAAAIEAALCGTQTLHIKLTKPMRVMVFYATAAATESRGMLFSDDIYGHDRRLETLLSRPRAGDS
jgi:murein L,D-transpeptidase YcbB/YkuD